MARPEDARRGDFREAAGAAGGVNLRDAERRLREAGVASPDVDALRLVMAAVGRDRAGAVALGDDRGVPGLDDLVARRVAREPLQWIEGEAAFLDFAVAVGPGVLVPRPETEVAATVAIEVARDVAARDSPEGRRDERVGDPGRDPGAPGAGLRVLDCGTGTGVLAAALARALPGAEVHATERAQPALVWAQRNLARLAPGVVLHQGWYLSAPGDFDLVVSNPPYVDADEWESLEPEVRDHDPRSALVPAGGDGLADVALLARESRSRARAFVCEIGATQGEAAGAVATQAGWPGVDVRPDLAGRDRVLVCRG